MRKVIGLIIVMAMIVVPGVVLAGDVTFTEREMLIMKRDLINERVLRLTAQYRLYGKLRVEMEKAIPELRAQLKQYNEQLIAMEAEKLTEPVKNDGD